MGNDRPISMRDIARLSGVSIATVSRVINHTGRFSEETRQRVQKVIDENGYVTNIAARNLRESRTKTIGMVVPDISNDFFSSLSLRVERFFTQHGYSVFICDTMNDIQTERDCIHTLVSKRVDGIICISGFSTLNDETILHNTPVVCIDRYPGKVSTIHRVISQDVKGGYIATEHLIEQGCQHILFLSSLVTDFNKKNREEGYQLALQDHNLAIDPRYIILLPGMQSTMIEAASKVTQCISGGLAFDGIFAVSDHAAVGALQAIHAAGIPVPDDVKIVGFDNSISCEITSPQLTSIQRFPDQLAETGCKTLLQLMNGEDAPLETTVPVELVQRESTSAV